MELPDVKNVFFFSNVPDAKEEVDFMQVIYFEQNELNAPRRRSRVYPLNPWIQSNLIRKIYFSKCGINLLLN